MAGSSPRQIATRFLCSRYFAFLHVLLHFFTRARAFLAERPTLSIYLCVHLGGMGTACVACAHVVRASMRVMVCAVRGGLSRGVHCGCGVIPCERRCQAPCVHAALVSAFPSLYSSPGDHP